MSKIIKVAKRLASGWTEYQTNHDREHCDDCGARLWVSPGGDLYCDAMSDKHEKRAL